METLFFVLGRVLGINNGIFCEQCNDLYAAKYPTLFMSTYYCLQFEGYEL